MDDTLISVTLAARQFSDCINRVRYQGTSFLLEKNGVHVARIIPVRQNFGSDFEKLAATLRQTRKTAPSDPEKEELPAKSTINEGQARQNQEPWKLPKRPALNW